MQFNNRSNPQKLLNTSIKLNLKMKHEPVFHNRLMSFKVNPLFNLLQEPLTLFS